MEFSLPHNKMIFKEKFLLIRQVTHKIRMFYRETCKEQKNKATKSIKRFEIDFKEPKNKVTNMVKRSKLNYKFYMVFFYKVSQSNLLCEKLWLSFI